MTTQTDSTKRRFTHAIIGCLLAFGVWWLVPEDEFPRAPVMAGIITLMAYWWILEVIPIPVTSLLPIVLMPLFRISDVDEVGPFYGKPIIFLFLGGFLLAIALQESGVHRRMALHIVRFIGSKPQQLLLGFMIASAALSMWISNTATVMVMLPVALSLMDGMEKHGHGHLSKSISVFGTALMLSIAYAADIGGMSTPVGTPPNLIFLEMFKEFVPNATPPGFIKWMSMALPLSIAFLFIGWYALTHWVFKLKNVAMMGGREVIDNEIQKLGPLRKDEIRAVTIFLIAVLMWMTGSDVKINDSFTIHGWRAIEQLSWISDPVVAIFCAALLFFVPSGDKPGKALLQWSHGEQVPWGILLLFGGGFAIAGGFASSGLDKVIKSGIEILPQFHPVVLVIAVCIVMTLLTEISSNSAATSLMLPLMVTLAAVQNIDPLWLMFPATLSASCAFMMPIASPTQAIIFGTKYITVPKMLRAGLWFNLIGVLLMSLLFGLLISLN
ncbi:MAG: DASS family sodium-coupled anion symporter [Bacteroidetes bacterium]|nr:DASS family sodium-coupled anion symporter [Bacteroidota bacterium]